MGLFPVAPPRRRAFSMIHSKTPRGRSTAKVPTEPYWAFSRQKQKEYIQRYQMVEANGLCRITRFRPPKSALRERRFFQRARRKGKRTAGHALRQDITFPCNAALLERRPCSGRLNGVEPVIKKRAIGLGKAVFIYLLVEKDLFALWFISELPVFPQTSWTGQLPYPAVPFTIQTCQTSADSASTLPDRHRECHAGSREPCRPASALHGMP